MKNKKIYILIFLLLVLGGLVYFGFSSSRCYGSECDTGKDKKQELSTFVEYADMNPETLPNKVLNKEVFLLDVREDSEWVVGYIDGASHLPLGEINKESIGDLPKDKPIYIYCRSGRRAGEAVMKLKSLGFRDVYNIGGINHWLERGGELVR
jgi:phage shock protein E